jgi:hypothetical protein
MKKWVCLFAKWKFGEVFVEVCAKVLFGRRFFFSGLEWWQHDKGSGNKLGTNV